MHFDSVAMLFFVAATSVLLDISNEQVESKALGTAGTLYRALFTGAT